MRIFALFALCAACPIAAHAQAVTSLAGTVTDPSGAAIPHATLTLINEDNSNQRAIVSDAQGRYAFQQVQPGRYHLEAKAAGFSDMIINNLRLLVNSPATVPVVFEKVGTVETTVAVTGEVVPINTADASIGNAIGDKVITQLPFEARNVVGLLALQPG